MSRYHIGVIYERLGDLDAAAREFQRSMDDGIGEVSSVYHLAQLHKARGDEKTAEKLLKHAQEFGRKNVT
jgi:Flp pilus assembly protein TadD